MTITLRPCPTDPTPSRGLRAPPLTPEQQAVRWAAFAAAAAWREQVRVALYALPAAITPAQLDLLDARLWRTESLRADHDVYVLGPIAAENILASTYRAWKVEQLLDPARLAAAMRVTCDDTSMMAEVAAISATMGRIVVAMGLAA